MLQKNNNADSRKTVENIKNYSIQNFSYIRMKVDLDCSDKPYIKF